MARDGHAQDLDRSGAEWPLEPPTPARHSRYGRGDRGGRHRLRPSGRVHHPCARLRRRRTADIRLAGVRAHHRRHPRPNRCAGLPVDSVGRHRNGANGRRSRATIRARGGPGGTRPAGVCRGRSRQRQLHRAFCRPRHAGGANLLEPRSTRAPRTGIRRALRISSGLCHLRAGLHARGARLSPAPWAPRRRSTG